MIFSLNLQGFSVFAAAAANSGSDLNAALEVQGIQVSSEGVLFPQWPLSTVASLLEALEEGARRQHFPFAFADVFRFEGHAAVAAFLASAGSLREIRPLMDWIPNLIHPAIKMNYADDGSWARLRVGVADTQGGYVDMPVLVELIMAVTARLARLVAPEIIEFSQVNFAHPARHAASSYEYYFGCPVTFLTGCNQLVIASKNLDAQLPGRMPQANAQAVKSIHLNLLGDGVAPSLTAMLEKLLQERLELIEKGIEGVAKVMKMHPRALQRQLQLEGNTYSELLAKVRHEKACAMLRDSSLDIESIGIKLGFSDRRSFTQAFGKWQSQTPSNYRRQTQD
jgi:AraC-like DNA-binding protein